MRIRIETECDADNAVAIRIQEALCSGELRLHEVKLVVDGKDLHTAIMSLIEARCHGGIALCKTDLECKYYHAGFPTIELELEDDQRTSGEGYAGSGRVA